MFDGPAGHDDNGSDHYSGTIDHDLAVNIDNNVAILHFRSTLIDDGTFYFDDIALIDDHGATVYHDDPPA